MDSNIDLCDRIRDRRLGRLRSFMKEIYYDWDLGSALGQTGRITEVVASDGLQLYQLCNTAELFQR